MCRTAAFILGLLLPGWASAHPHVWIDVHSTFIVDEGGSVTAIRQKWMFDLFYSSFLLQDLKGRWRSPDTFVAEAMKNLRSYSYFMEVRSSGGVLKFDRPTEAVGAVSDGQLTMQFTANLPASADEGSSNVELMVFDPTFYIDMQHVKERPVSLEGVGAALCSSVVEEQNPSEEVRMRAQAMDQNAEVDATLGRQFAQTVRVTCKRKQ